MITPHIRLAGIIEDNRLRGEIRVPVTLGVLMAIIFSAAAAYPGLKIGQVFEAAIPIDVYKRQPVLLARLEFA